MDDVMEIDAAEISWFKASDGEPALAMKIRGEIYCALDIQDAVEKLGKDKVARLMVYLILTEKMDRNYTVRDLEVIWDSNSHIFNNLD